MKKVMFLFVVAILFPFLLQGQEDGQKTRSYVPRFWVLNFKHQDPKRFEFTFSNYVVRKGYIGRKIKRALAPSELSNHEVYWYMIYKLTTTDKKPIPVFIDIVAESTTHEAPRLKLTEEEKKLYPPRPRRVIHYHDGYYPLVKQAIELKLRRKFLGQNDLTIPSKIGPRKREHPTKLNLPLLGGVSKTKEAILNFIDGSKLRGKITFINEDRIRLTEFQGEWNLIPFIHSLIKNKDKIQRMVIKKEGDEEVEGKIADFVQDEILIKKFDEDKPVPLHEVKSISVDVERAKVPSISYECIAIFKGWDRHMDHLKITVKGLTNGILYNVGQRKAPLWSRAGPLLSRRMAEQEAEYLERYAKSLEAQGHKEEAKSLMKLVEQYRSLGPHDRASRYTVYEIFYERPGDEFYTTLDKMIFKKKQWKTYLKIIKTDLPNREGD
ncbi:MAG: hypothetical protein D6785_10920 [Planctomycetota bacterium]|nr:MAG: hypothetical protein D6785_10920 [Planctomycetota bacterium]